MSSREAILGGLRAALGRAEGDGARQAVAARLAARATHPIPARAQVPHDEQVELFRRLAGEVGATSEILPGPAAVPEAVTRYLAQQNLPAEAAIAPDPELRAIPWHERPMLALKPGRTHGDDLVGITGAFAAVAETGTLVTHSGAHHPTTLNFLSETHIVVLPKARILGTYDEVWKRLRAVPGFVPRTVNFITGPSRTADIEQTIQRGAHGPRRLHVLIVDGGS